MITVLFSCKASEKEKTIEKTVEKVTAMDEKITFTVIKNGDNSTYKKAQNNILNTQQELDLAWGKMFGNFLRKPPIPMVDFETKQLILVAMGEQANGGFSIKIASINETVTDRTVTIEDAKPGKTCANTSALIYPFQLVEVTKTTKKYIYKRISSIKECEK